MERMLEICRKPGKVPTMTPEIQQALKIKEIVITKYKTVETVNADGSINIKNVPVNVNITKLVNEQKKLVKNYSAEEKLKELEQIFTK